VVPPIWLDEDGQKRKTRRCWTCGSEVPVMRYRSETLRQLGWQPCKTQMVVEWCGHAQEYAPWREADGYWRMVPVFGEAS
jgi:hypothetical protein